LRKAGRASLIDNSHVGTPHGVGPVNVGDKVSAGLSIPEQSDLLASLELEAVARDGGYTFKG
jgi:acylpyruvate hydrolase